jgi:hypothetical protein
MTSVNKAARLLDQARVTDDAERCLARLQVFQPFVAGPES